MSLSTMKGDAGAANVSEKIPDPSVIIAPKISNPWTVDKVLTAITLDKPMEGSSSPVPYFHLLERLKTTKREGWRRFGINRGESIADHMYRMSLMTMLAPASLMSRLDLFKCMKMCLIHDMPESLVGDITPMERVSKTEKIRREKLTMDYIAQRLLGDVQGGDPIVGTEIRTLWQEYEDSETLESQFVQDIDKVELLLQMVEYERRGEGKVDLSEFTYVATKVSLPETKAWAKEILKERDEVWGGKKLVDGEIGEASSASLQMKKMQDQYYDGES